MKIIISVFIAFLFSFLILIYVQHMHPDPLLERQREFYAQKLDPNKEKLFLLEASHVGQLNITKIN